MATFDSFPFDAGPGANITEDRWTNMFTWMRTVGVLSEDTTLAPDSELAVNPADPSVGTQVQVEDGEAFIQGFMFIQTDGPEVLDITLNDSGDPRIDLVVLRLDKPNDIISYVVIEGTPDPSPVPPDIIQNSTIWDLPLAEVAVADSATEILPGDITDLRVRSLQGDGGSSAVTLTSAGGTETLVNDGTGPDLSTKGLTAGSNITLTGSGTDVTIAATGAGSDITLSNAGTTSLVNDGVGPDLATKGLVAGTGISFSTSATDVTIDATGSEVTLTNAGTTTLVNDGTGPTLATKGLVAGTGITFSTSSTDVTITQSQTPVCFVSTSVNFTFTTSQTQSLLWDTNNLDPFGMHSTSSNTEKINILENGIYHVLFWVRYPGNTGITGGLLEFKLLLGRSMVETPLTFSDIRPSAYNSTYTQQLSTTYNFLNGDYIYIQAVSSWGNAVTITTSSTVFPYFNVVKIGY